MHRRNFLKAGTATLSALATMAPKAVAQSTADVRIELAIRDTNVEMVDGTAVRMLGYQLVRYACRSGGAARSAECGQAWVPGPVLRVTQGQRVTVVVHNFRPEPHGFEITGIPSSRIVLAGGSAAGPGVGEATFTAADCGTYLYHDASHNGGRSPLYRILGLHGAFVIQPDYAALHRSGDVVTPYGSAAPEKLKSLFRTLADPAAFLAKFPQLRGVYYPGAWRPVEDLADEYGKQEKVWIISQVDPRLNALIDNSGINASPLTTNLADSFEPRYFTINGRSGFDLVDGDDVVVKARVGEPTLIRTLNAGLAHHAMHIHGNHIYEIAEAELRLETVTPPATSSTLSRPRTSTTAVRSFPFSRAVDSGAVIVRPAVFERDVWPMYPMQRKDVLLPLQVPPDIPVGQFEEMARRNVFIDHGTEYDSTREPFPLRYPVHCHCEMSQTAGGGNYPQGLTTHWEIIGGPQTVAATASTSGQG